MPLIAIAFLMTMLGVPLMVFPACGGSRRLPHGRQDHLRCCYACRARALWWGAAVAALGHIHHKGQVTLMHVDMLGVLMCAFGLSTVAATELHLAICCRRGAGRGIRNDQFAGAVDRAG